MNINEFQKFDYGKEMNLKVYGSIDPPKYDLSKVQVPIAIFYSDNDFITVSEVRRATWKKFLSNIELIEAT